MEIGLFCRLSYRTRLLAFFFAFLTAVGFYYFPLISDDLTSTVSVSDSFLYGERIDWQAYVDKLKGIFRYDHFRLPNLVMPLTILLPRWMPAVIGGFSMWVILAAGMCDKKPLHNAVYVSLIIIFFPWLDQLYLISFQAPYLWGAAMSLILLKIVLKNQSCNVITFVLSLVVGFWLEAYGGAILGAWLCLIIFYPKYRNKHVFTSVIGLIIGLLIAALPLLLFSKWTRWTFMEGRMIMVYPYLGLTIVFLLMTILYWQKGKDPINLVLLEISIASALMTAYFRTGARVDGLGVICSAIGITRLGGMIINKKFSWTVAVSCIGFALIVIHLIGVDMMCYRLRREYDNIISRYRNGEKSPLFAEITLRQDCPLWLMQKPYYDWWAHNSTMNVINSVYSNGVEDLRVVPQQLSNFNKHESAPVAGLNNLFVYKGYMVSDKDLGEDVKMDFGLGARKGSYYRVAFKASGDTTTYYWYYPDNTRVDFLINPIPVSASMP